MIVLKPSILNPMNHSNARSQINELFAMKRQEKSPENFMKDFIVEFHRRIDLAGPKPRRITACKNNLLALYHEN